jgi:hypothetical protein
MISKQKFKEAISTLEIYFDKKIQPQTAIIIWFNHLDQSLTDEELDDAVEQAVIKCRPHPSFMPTPEELVGFVKGGREIKALQEWQLVMCAAARQDESQLAYISQRGRVALHAIGGLRTVGLAEEYKRNQLEKSFITVYCQCADKDAKTLPPAMSQPPTVRSDEEFTPVPEHLKQQMEQLKAKLSMNGNGKH